MPDFDEDFDWQAQFVPIITPILGAHLIRAAPVREDLKHNCDFMVLEVGVNVRVACRIRRYAHLIRKPAWGNQFTIRSSRPRGVKTELAKVIEGFGTHMLYGWSDEWDKGLACWLLADLNVFRAWHASELDERPPGKRRWAEIPNEDGSSRFRVYRLADMPSGFVLAREKPRLPIVDGDQSRLGWSGVVAA